MAEQEGKEEKRGGGRRRRIIPPKKETKEAEEAKGLEKLPPEILELVDWFGSAKDAARAARSATFMTEIRRGLVKKCEKLTEHGRKCPQLLRKTLPLPARQGPVEHGCYTWCEKHLRFQIQERLVGALLRQPVHWTLEEGIEFKWGPLTEASLEIEFKHPFPGLEIASDFESRNEVVFAELDRRYRVEIAQGWKAVLTEFLDFASPMDEREIPGPEPEQSMLYRVEFEGDERSPELGNVLTRIATVSPLFMQHLFAETFPYPPSAERKAFAKAWEQYEETLATHGGGAEVWGTEANAQHQLALFSKALAFLATATRQIPNFRFSIAQTDRIHRARTVILDLAKEIGAAIP